MWPVLFGSGWIWGALVAVALLAFIAGGLGFLFAVTRRPGREPDDLDRAWHRYEEGDLTRAEWEHLRRLAATRPQSHSRAL